jgi:hypothetical protein
MKTLFFITIFLSLNYAQQHSDARVNAQKINIKWNNKIVEAFEGEFLVTLGDMKYLNSVSNYLKNKADAEIIYNFDHLGVGCFKTKNKNFDIISLIKELEKTEYFVNIELNLVINMNYSPNDQYFNSHQWSLNQISSSYLTDDADIDLPQAWDITTGSENIIIAILDSGIPILNGTLSHEDLLGSKIII